VKPVDVDVTGPNVDAKAALNEVAEVDPLPFA